MGAVKYILLTSVVAFLFVCAPGITQLGMSTDIDGQTSNCPLMGMPALCHMSPLEHAFALQNILTVVPFSGIFALFAALLLALSIVLLAPVLLSIAVNLFKPPPGTPTRTDRFVPQHSLQEAFSNGILNSKAF